MNVKTVQVKYEVIRDISYVEYDAHISAVREVSYHKNENGDISNSEDLEYLCLTSLVGSETKGLTGKIMTPTGVSNKRLQFSLYKDEIVKSVLSYTYGTDGLSDAQRKNIIEKPYTYILENGTKGISPYCYRDYDGNLYNVQGMPLPRMIAIVVIIDHEEECLDDQDLLDIARENAFYIRKDTSYSPYNYEYNTDQYTLKWVPTKEEFLEIWSYNLGFTSDVIREYILKKYRGGII